ncbi:MAG: hypothetical protein AAGG00_05490 [Cyanobacteria bacterium P01_H01_bin.150]
MQLFLVCTSLFLLLASEESAAVKALPEYSGGGVGTVARWDGVKPSGKSGRETAKNKK